MQLQFFQLVVLVSNLVFLLLFFSFSFVSGDVLNVITSVCLLFSFIDTPPFCIQCILIGVDFSRITWYTFVYRKLFTGSAGESKCFE